MLSQNDIQKLIGADVHESDGTKIGAAADVYLDARTGDPEWLSVKTGLFGTKQSFVPLDGAHIEGDRIIVAFGKAQVKDAPRIDPDGRLTPAEEDELYHYYGLSSTDGNLDRDDRGDTRGPVPDDAMTRSEQPGKARLRRYVVTEQLIDVDDAGGRDRR